MKLAVIGNKEYYDYSKLSSILAGMENVSLIISGGAAGTDTMAKQYAMEKGITFQEFPPDYARYGDEAKHVRDRQIIDSCDRVLAFWNGKCEGTLYTIEYALKRNRYRLKP